VRGLLTLLTVCAVVIGLTPASADSRHSRPRITIMRWKQPPVTSSNSNCEEGCKEEILIVKAQDRNSSITEVQVWFSENDDAGPVVFAHTGCVQGRKAGTPARLEIGATYDEPGTYTVAAVAYSHRRCLSHERGDGHPQQHSPVTRLRTEVEAPQ
jgi:hypothetical protein